MAKNTVTIPTTRTCAFCGKKIIIMIDYFDLRDYLKCAVPLNKTFPHLTADERDFIIYDLCPECMKKRKKIKST